MKIRKTTVTAAAGRARLVAAFTLLVTACGCAERIPEPVIVPSAPHISWLIAVHSGNDNEQTVCQSDPRTDCVLVSATAGARRMVTVHLYLHPSTVQTKYVGAMQLGFLNGSAEPHETRVNSTVKRGSSPVGVSVTGVLTSKPGTYPMTIALTAETSSTQRPVDIREMLSVTVK
jgi:hypothetical protein